MVQLDSTCTQPHREVRDLVVELRAFELRRVQPVGHFIVLLQGGAAQVDHCESNSETRKSHVRFNGWGSPGGACKLWVQPDGSNLYDSPYQGLAAAQVDEEGNHRARQP
jgi:hypothetical protein